MAKIITSVNIRITGPDCWLGDRLLMPGETVTVDKAFADQLIETERAVLTAEVKDDGKD